VTITRDDGDTANEKANLPTASPRHNLMAEADYFEDFGMRVG